MQSKSDIYHVVSRGTGRQLIFEDDEDRTTFLRMLSKATASNEVELYAWCLMGNHFHLLVHGDLARLSCCMKQLCGSYAQYFNQEHGRVGHLFQERFKSEPVENDAYLLTVVRYIHDNPAKAAISPMTEYPWSSYHEYAEDHEEAGLCSTQFILDAFGGRTSFVRFHADERNATPCLDVFTGRSKTRGMPDSIAAEIAEDVLGVSYLEDMKSLPIDERNASIHRLKNEGLTVRQIERLTGIGRNSVQRA